MQWLKWGGVCLVLSNTLHRLLLFSDRRFGLPRLIKLAWRSVACVAHDQEMVRERGRADGLNGAVSPGAGAVGRGFEMALCSTGQRRVELSLLTAAGLLADCQRRAGTTCQAWAFTIPATLNSVPVHSDALLIPLLGVMGMCLIGVVFRGIRVDIL
jgi:hypothetical protein